MSNINMKSAKLTPLGVYKEGMNWNPVEKVIFERRSIRAYKKEPLPDSMIRRILEAARFAPSAGNCQPWKFIVVKSPEILAEMEKDAVKMCKKIMRFMDYTKKGGLPAFLVKRLIKLMHNELHPVPFAAMQQMAAEKLPVFHGAPTLILILIDTRGLSNPYIDIGIAGQNLILAAHS
ncbi:MAG: nitroreductase family protein, partial [Promethearchaeota archaeon]